MFQHFLTAVVRHAEGVCETIHMTYSIPSSISFCVPSRVVGGFDVLNAMEKIETDDKDHPTVSLMLVSFNLSELQWYTC